MDHPQNCPFCGQKRFIRAEPRDYPQVEYVCGSFFDDDDRCVRSNVCTTLTFAKTLGRYVDVIRKIKTIAEKHAGNSKLMQVAGPHRQILNIIKELDL